MFCYWQQTLQSFGVDQITAELTFAHLVTAYSTGDRHYHTLKHINHVLGTIDTLQAYAQDLPAVQLAAWFHDVVYNTQAQDNEEKSAHYADKVLSNLGIPTNTIATVNRLILNTKQHQAATEDYDSQVLLDADLAILATQPIQYQKYAHAIRQEYAWLSELEYITGRKKVLEHFLQQQSIYHTPLMCNIAEQSARFNLQAEIQTLNLSHG
ncbi:hypothetical protein VB620_01470 [Nodularia harveyana UHCC-0300]|uniref:HD domain-containing protein n=1 Tax=Nodularia harveyana UHCC-0300 TaxID=2974287 RepID=A0ABU5U926_9CYAN|nr:hypothetical protein [Nodularia harveyana]MEA5580007.1 hypothetical protein [Nodularia harveyana UHCC-0300]